MCPDGGGSPSTQHVTVKSCQAGHQLCLPAGGRQVDYKATSPITPDNEAFQEAILDARVSWEPHCAFIHSQSHHALRNKVSSFTAQQHGLSRDNQRCQHCRFSLATGDYNYTRPLLTSCLSARYKSRTAELILTETNTAEFHLNLSTNSNARQNLSTISSTLNKDLLELLRTELTGWGIPRLPWLPQEF